MGNHQGEMNELCFRTLRVRSSVDLFEVIALIVLKAGFTGGLVVIYALKLINLLGFLFILCKKESGFLFMSFVSTNNSSTFYYLNFWSFEFSLKRELLNFIIFFWSL